MRVLVTGACGWTATAIVAALAEAGHAVAGLDLPGATCPADTLARLDRLWRGDIARFDDALAATRGIDAVVHLAVAVGEVAYRTPDGPFAVNVLGTYNLFEAARRNAVGTVVLMSEAAVHLPARPGERLGALDDWRSSPGDDHLYDLTKRLQETIARDYCETHGMRAVALRAGHIVDGRAGSDARGRPLAELDYCRGGWVCRYDVAQACVKALGLRRAGYSAYHVVGARQAVDRFDIERTERELALRFSQRFEAYEGAPSPGCTPGAWPS